MKLKKANIKIGLICNFFLTAKVAKVIAKVAKVRSTYIQLCVLCEVSACFAVNGFRYINSKLDQL
jgi:hypothetical protein